MAVLRIAILLPIVYSYISFYNEWNNYIYIKKLINEYFGDWENNSPMPNRRVYNINITDKSGIDVRFIPFEDQDRARILILKKTTDLDQFWDPAIQMALYVFGHIGNSRKHKIHQMFY